MYIGKYWGNFIGGSDDSLNLVAFLENQKKEEIPLSEIFAKVGLDKQNWDFHQTVDPEYLIGLLIFINNAFAIHRTETVTFILLQFADIFAGLQSDFTRIINFLTQNTLHIFL